MDKTEFAFNTERPCLNTVPTMWWKACTPVALLFLLWFFSLLVHAKRLEYSVSIGDKEIGVIYVETIRSGRVRYSFHPHPDLSGLRPSGLYLSDRFTMSERVVRTFGIFQDEFFLPLDNINVKGSESYRAPSVPAPHGLGITYYHIGSLIALFQLNAVVDIWVDRSGLVTSENMVVNEHGQVTGDPCMKGTYFLPSELADYASTSAGAGQSILFNVCFPLLGIGEGTLVRRRSELTGSGGQNHDVTVSVSGTSVDLFIMMNSHQVIESVIMNMPDGQNTVTVTLSSAESTIMHVLRKAKDKLIQGRKKKRQME